MPLHPGWEEIAIRLVLTILAGAVIGFNRGETGHAAGLRTTILVCLAASVAMMQANVLLPTGGKAHDSFTIIDVGRWPLGILTGVGFIGAGAILRRGSILQGVTTAATMWFVTVIGLCLGGGQLGLGIAGTALGVAVLWGVKWLDDRMPRVQRARLTVASDREIDVARLIGDDFPRHSMRLRVLERDCAQGRAAESQYDVQWLASAKEAPPLRCLDTLRREPGVTAVAWRV